MDSLRRRAEKLLKKRPPPSKGDFPSGDARLMHELMTHQIELEMQNEELRAAQLQLEESREQFHDLYDFAPVGYFSIDRKGSIIRANLTCAAMLGIERDKLINTSFYRYVARDSSDTFYLHHKEVIETGKRQTCEIKCVRKNGAPFYASLESILYHAKSTRIVISDITDRKKAEEHAAYLSSFAQLDPNPIIEVDSSGKITFSNPAVERSLEIAGLGEKGIYFFLPADLDEILGDLKKQKGTSFYREATVGERLFGEIVYLPPQLPVARIYAFDITGRRRAELAQREVEERIRLIAETSIDVIFQVDVSGKVTYCSPAVSQYGYSQEKIIGSDFRAFIADDGQDIEAAAFQRAISGEYIKSLEITILTANGTPVQTEINIAPIIVDGNIVGLQGMSRDITERKKAEQALKLSNAELRRAEAKLLKANKQLLSQTKELSEHREHLSELVGKRTADLTDAIARLNAEIAERRQAEESLKESDRQIRHLSSQLLAAQEVERRRISMELHDSLGQALNGVKLHIRAIDRSLGLEQSKAKEECEHLLGYIDRVIEDVRRLSLDLSPAVLDDLGVTSALKWLITNLKKTSVIKVTSDIAEIDDLIPESQWIVVYRVLQEGINNIVKHAKARNVHVRIRRQDDRVTFSVEDDGKGFDIGEAKARNASKKGLGLATMKDRVRMIGGVFDLWSKEGKGTRVVFSIPIEQGEV